LQSPRQNAWMMTLAPAACCRVLQCVAVCCSVLQCAAVCCSVLQCVAACCSVLQHVVTLNSASAGYAHCLKG